MTDKNLKATEPSAEDSKAVIAELAKLSLLDYELQREKSAEALSIRVSVLDKLVEAERPTPDDDPINSFEEVVACSTPVDGSELVAEIKTTIERFCVLPEHSATIMAFWVLHAYAHDAADISPILAFVSPEKRCGKTTALSVIGALVPKPMPSVNISPAVLFRVIENYGPTVLIDEGDTFLNDNDGLRGILNGGHNRLNAYVWRAHGDDHDPKRFNVWAPKCIAMIGRLPDTLEDRSLVVPLRRKQAGEHVERFRADRINDFAYLRSRSMRWAQDNIRQLEQSDPELPDELNDRAQDNARGLVAIADVVGGEWPKTFREALVGLANLVDDELKSPGILLLQDIAGLFEERNSTQIGSTELCNALCDIPDAPWSEWRRGKPLTTRGIATLLKPFGIAPKHDRNIRFYSVADFQDAFNRYLDNSPEKSVTSAPSDTATPDQGRNIIDMTHGDGCDANSVVSGEGSVKPKPNDEKYLGDEM
jgi:putative DNA primase/helicase